MIGTQIAEHLLRELIDDVGDVSPWMDVNEHNVCRFCDRTWNHEPSCWWVRARLALGMEATIRCPACWSIFGVGCTTCDDRHEIPATQANVVWPEAATRWALACRVSGRTPRTGECPLHHGDRCLMLMVADEVRSLQVLFEEAVVET